jgi:phosphoribosylamine--glycine ligase
MKVLVIGSGGREHALVYKILQSKRVSEVYCAPGNGGTAEIAKNININPKDIDLLLNFALKESIDLTIVGPEDPLVDGIVDKFEENGLRIFGPRKKGAVLEGSKLAAKEFMEKYGIPTAKYKSFKDAKEAIEALGEFSYPVVIKADGLCLGKGVLICETEEDAVKAIKEMIDEKRFGTAGETVVIEEFLTGTEASLLCFVSEGTIIPMESARDYKKIFDGDKGPNTGGVGCFSPNTIFTKELEKTINKEILQKIKIGLEAEEMDYKGILFIGLMITKDGPKVLEFNVRFGDPETEVVIPRLKSDIVDIFQKTIDGTLRAEDLCWTDKKCVTVVATSKGYPMEYEKGKEIKGIELLDEDIILFHNGTKKVDGKILTNGGRVLSVTALGETMEEARNKAYQNIKKLYFDGISYRKDVGKIN